MNINNITLAGRLVNDPELTFIGEKNTPKAVFKLAVNRIGTDKTDFIHIEVFGAQAENCEKYLVKGQIAGVTGSLRIDSWQKDGNWHSRTYVAANSVQFGNKPNGKQEEARGEEPKPIPF
jgi:single-strand DNA-binding protein